jgi:hypothetical protein
MPASDEANAEDKHAEGQQCCTDIGEIDETIRGFGIRRQHGEEEGRRDWDRGDGDRGPHEPLRGGGQIGFIDVAERHERQNEPDTSVGVYCLAPIAQAGSEQVRWRFPDQFRRNKRPKTCGSR